MPESAAAFGRTLRRKRTAAGLTQEALASASGLHRTFISMLERGVRNPSLEVIFKLAAALGQSPGSLVDEVAREAHGG